MQIINIKFMPNGDEDPIGSDNPFLVDVPDADFDRLVGEIEDSVSSYMEHVDTADTEPQAQIAETVMKECGYPYLPITRARTVTV